MSYNASHYIAQRLSLCRTTPLIIWHNASHYVAQRMLVCCYTEVIISVYGYHYAIVLRCGCV
jgi:hypothetical protein